MPGIPPEIEVYPVQHLPIIKAYADQLGLVSLINHYVPTEMDVDAGTIVLGLVLDTLSGRSPLYRLEEFFAYQDTALLLGKALPPHAFTDDTVGRVLDRLYDFGTMRLFTACAVRAVTRFDLERRYVHFDTTSRSVWGDYQSLNLSQFVARQYWLRNSTCPRCCRANLLKIRGFIEAYARIYTPTSTNYKLR